VRVQDHEPTRFHPTYAAERSGPLRVRRIGPALVGGRTGARLLVPLGYDLLDSGWPLSRTSTRAARLGADRAPESATSHPGERSRYDCYAVIERVDRVITQERC
jgi:hypothetical protein